MVSNRSSTNRCSADCRSLVALLNIQLTRSSNIPGSAHSHAEKIHQSQSCSSRHCFPRLPCSHMEQALLCHHQAQHLTKGKTEDAHFELLQTGKPVPSKT